MDSRRLRSSSSPPPRRVLLPLLPLLAATTLLLCGGPLTMDQQGVGIAVVASGALSPRDGSISGPSRRRRQRRRQRRQRPDGSMRRTRSDPSSNAKFRSLGQEAKTMAEMGEYAEALRLFHSQLKTSQGPRQRFRALNNLAVTHMRRANEQQSRLGAVGDYREALGFLGRARKISSKPKMLGINEQALEKACRERYYAESCVGMLESMERKEAGGILLRLDGTRVDPASGAESEEEAWELSPDGAAAASDESEGELEFAMGIRYATENPRKYVSAILHFQAAAEHLLTDMAAAIILNNVAACYLSQSIRLLPEHPRDAKPKFSETYLKYGKEALNLAAAALPSPGPVLETIRENEEFLNDIETEISVAHADALGAVSSAEEQAERHGERAAATATAADPPSTPVFDPVEVIAWPPAGYAGTVGQFLRHRRTPCRITGSAVSDWHLLHTWDLDYLEKHLPHQLHVSATSYNTNLYGTDKQDTPMPAPEFFARLRYMNRTAGVPFDGKYTYMSFQDKWTEAMQDDIMASDVSYVSAGSTPIGRDGSGSETLILWVGAPNVSAVAHYDLSFNAFVLLSGRKRFILASPEDAPKLYLHPAPSDSHRQSQIRSLDHIDFDSFPNARKANLLETTVEAGDVLFIPPFWLHNVISLDTTVALSVWSYPAPYMTYADLLPGDISAERKEDLKAAMQHVDAAENAAVGAACRTFHLIRQLIEVLGSRQAARDHIEDLLSSKYETAGPHWCNRKAAWCPDLKLVKHLPKFLVGTLEADVQRRKAMFDHLSAGGRKMPVDLLMTSTEYLSHTVQANGNTISHGDDYGLMVCDFLRSCVLPLVEHL